MSYNIQEQFVLFPSRVWWGDRPSVREQVAGSRDPP